MNRSEVLNLVLQLDTNANQDDILGAIVDQGKDALLAIEEALPRLRKWQSRERVVQIALKFARANDCSRRIGAVGLTDKSKVVRSTACALAAFSLDNGFIPSLEHLATSQDSEVAADAAAAIAAIRSQNHHYYMDREQTGLTTWNVIGSGLEE